MRKIKFTLTPVGKKDKSNDLASLNYTREVLLLLARQYDKESPYWVIEEKRIGDQIRRDKKFGMDTLKEIVHWKFLNLPGREKRVKNLLKQHSDKEVREITGCVLSLPTSEDRKKINTLRMLKGIGVSLASVILAFYNPHEYCVYDIHIIREVYGKEPKYMFSSNKHYLRLLNDLREYSTRVDMPVRSIEKALFKKNFEKHFILY